MKDGDIVAIEKPFGDIELVRFMSHSDGDWFNAYLHFDMSTGHPVCERLSTIVPLREVKNLIDEQLGLEK